MGLGCWRSALPTANTPGSFFSAACGGSQIGHIAGLSDFEKALPRIFPFEKMYNDFSEVNHEQTQRLLIPGQPGHLPGDPGVLARRTRTARR